MYRKFKCITYCVGALYIDKPHYNITLKKAIDIKHRSAKRNCNKCFFF